MKPSRTRKTRGKAVAHDPASKAVPASNSNAGELTLADVKRGITLSKLAGSGCAAAPGSSSVARAKHAGPNTVCQGSSSAQPELCSNAGELTLADFKRGITLSKLAGSGCAAAPAGSSSVARAGHAGPNTVCHGSSSAQPELCSNTGELTLADVKRRITLSKVTGSACATAPRSSSVARAGNAGPNTVCQGSSSVSTKSSKAMASASSSSTLVAPKPKVATQDSKRISTRSIKNEGLAVPLLFKAVPKGKRSAVSSMENAQSYADFMKYLAKESHAREVHHVLKGEYKSTNDGLENKDKKSMPSSLKQGIMEHIKCKGPPKPLGEKCQLCGIDLAFTQKGSESNASNDLPFSAVLPCGHSYHDGCLQKLFGAVEPPCVRCLDSEALKQS